MTTGIAARIRLVAAVTATALSDLRHPVRLVRWLYLNSRYAAGVGLRKAANLLLRWMDAQMTGRSLLRSADQRIVEALVPAVESVSELAKFDFAVEAHIRSRFAGLPIIRSGEWHRGTFRRFEQQQALFQRPYRILICVPWLRAGGADKVAANLTHAIADLYGLESVAVLVLDFTRSRVKRRYPEDTSTSSWFPKGISVIDLSDTTDIDHGLRLEILSNIFLAIAPEMIINVNSQTMWECYSRFGRQLSRHIRLCACLFSNEYNAYRAPAGYAATYFRDTLPIMDTIMSDQQYFLDELKLRYGLVSSETTKLRCLYQPTVPGRAGCDITRYERLSRSRTHRRQVLWASRVTTQKNPELLIEVARRNPSCDFHVYGARERGYRFPRMRNLFTHAAFSTFDDIPHEQYDLFLYTSLWDGLPNVLLEAGERRLPIIAPTVGGIGELVTPETGWPVADAEDTAAFSDSLRQVAFEFSRLDGGDRVDAMHRLIRSRHSRQAFASSVALLVDGEGTVECRLQAS